MSKADYETYVVRIGRRRGERYAERHVLNVPYDLARGNYERLSDLALREFANDVAAEMQRRSIKPGPAPAGYDPLNSQVRKPS